MKKQFTLLIILVLLCSFVYAQESEGFPSDEDYKNGDFYKNSDPAVWDWGKVDFSNPAVYQNSKLYFSPQFSAHFHKVPPVLYGMVKFYQLDFNQLPYGSLPDQFYQHPAFLFHLKRVPGNKYDQVKWDKVDFTKIHFKDVDWNAQLPASFHQTLAKNKNALNNYCRGQGQQACTITVADTDISGIVFTGKGMKTEQYGVELKHYPSGTSFEVKEGKIIAHLPQNQELRSPMLASDIVRIVAVQQIRFATQGKEVKIVQGELEYKNGEWFVPAGKLSVINHIEIIASKEINVHGLGGIDDAYFRKMEADIKNPRTLKSLYAEVRENAVYLGESNILAFGAKCENCPVTAETVTLNFQPGNPYITVKEAGESPNSQLYPDRLSITPVSGGAIWSGTGELTISGRVRMQNGVQEIIFDNGGVYAKAVLEHENEPFFDSVPMKVRFFDEYLNNPYKDQQGQLLKDRQGRVIENVIQIHEDNYIEFGNVEYFALSVDPHHLLTDTENGFKLVNNIARFTQPLIIVESPVGKFDEQKYFDAAAQILATNVEGVPITIKLKNPPSGYSKEERDRMIASHKNFFEALELEAAKSKFARLGGVRSEQAVIGHNWINEKSMGIVAVLKGEERETFETQSFVCYEKLIGCALGDIKLKEAYHDAVDMGIEGYTNPKTGEKKPPRLKEVDKLVQGRVIGGDVYRRPDGSFELNPEAYLKFAHVLRDRLEFPDVEELYYWKYIEEEKRLEFGIFPNQAPLHAAIYVAQLKNPELVAASAKDILLSAEMQSMKFPCGYAHQASEFASKAIQETVRYKEVDCKK